MQSAVLVVALYYARRSMIIADETFFLVIWIRMTRKNWFIIVD